MKTKEELIAFENWTVEQFNDGKLKSPVHLSGGNEDQLIEIFKEIKPQDWVFTTYRSHYHALLKGVPEQRLKDWILDNKSIHFMDKEYKVFSSAIVGGCLPIALGVAMAIRKSCVFSLESRKKVVDEQQNDGAPEHTSAYGDEKTEVNIPRVYCFIGDMTASLGVFKDCLQYAVTFQLPITFIIEDNGLSTDTKTFEAWGYANEEILSSFYKHYVANISKRHVKYYKYKRVWPHYGTGKFISSIWTDIIKQDDVSNKGF